MKNIVKLIVILFSTYMMLGCDVFPRVRYSLGSVDSFYKISTEKKLCNDLKYLFARKGVLREIKPQFKNVLCSFSGNESNSLVVEAMKDEGKIMVDIQSATNVGIVKIKKSVTTMLLKKYPNYKVVF